MSLRGRTALIVAGAGMNLSTYGIGVWGDSVLLSSGSFVGPGPRRAVGHLSALLGPGPVRRPYRPGDYCRRVGSERPSLPRLRAWSHGDGSCTIHIRCLEHLRASSGPSGFLRRLELRLPEPVLGDVNLFRAQADAHDLPFGTSLRSRVQRTVRHRLHGQPGAVPRVVHRPFRRRQRSPGAP